MKLHDIENAYIRMPAYIALMPICVLLVIAIFAVAGFFNGLYFCFSDDNRLITKRFWVSCWRGFMGY